MIYLKGCPSIRASKCSSWLPNHGDVSSHRQGVTYYPSRKQANRGRRRVFQNSPDANPACSLTFCRFYLFRQLQLLGRWHAKRVVLHDLFCFKLNSYLAIHITIVAARTSDVTFYRSVNHMSAFWRPYTQKHVLVIGWTFLRVPLNRSDEAVPEKQYRHVGLVKLGFKMADSKNYRKFSLEFFCKWNTQKHNS